MISVKENIKKIIEEEVEQIKCDCCFKKVIKNNDPRSECSYANLVFYKTDIESVKYQYLDDPKECEISELCERCYRDIVSFIKQKGGKVPSKYITNYESE